MNAKHSQKAEQRIRLYFLGSILLKGAISLLEVLAGGFLLFVPVSVPVQFLTRMIGNMSPQIVQSGLIAHLLHGLQALGGVSGLFIAIYLLSRGLIKVILIVALLKNRLWAYPSSLVVLGVFVLYQCYQLVTGLSGFIVALTIFDLVVMWSIWMEYGMLKSRFSQSVL